MSALVPMPSIIAHGGQRVESGRVQAWLDTQEARVAAGMIIGALRAQQQTQVISGQSIDLGKGPGRARRRL